MRNFTRHAFEMAWEHNCAVMTGLTFDALADASLWGGSLLPSSTLWLKRGCGLKPLREAIGDIPVASLRIISPQFRWLKWAYPSFLMCQLSTGLHWNDFSLGFEWKYNITANVGMFTIITGKQKVGLSHFSCLLAFSDPRDHSAWGSHSHAELILMESENRSLKVLMTAFNFGSTFYMHSSLSSHLQQQICPHWWLLWIDQGAGIRNCENHGSAVVFAEALSTKMSWRWRKICS